MRITRIIPTHLFTHTLYINYYDMNELGFPFVFYKETNTDSNVSCCQLANQILAGQFGLNGGKRLTCTGLSHVQVQLSSSVTVWPNAFSLQSLDRS